MHRIWQNDCASAIFAGLFLCSFAASAVDLKPSASIDMQYTDNATFSSKNEIDELIVGATVGAAINAGSGPYNFNANTSIRKQHYTQDTFGDQQYFNLAATAGWEMLKDRLDWTLENFFSQTSINSFSPDTPDNTQDTNILILGANIYFPISGRQSITLQPEYKKFTYDVQSVENQQNSLNANWNYKVSQTMSVGLAGSLSEVNYAEQAINDIKFRNVGLIVSGERSRSNYSFNLGVTHASRDDGSSSDRGFSGNVTWLFNLTGYSQVSISMVSNLTNSSNRLLDAARNPEDGDFSNQQISSEVFRNEVIRVAYTKKGATLSSSVWGELLSQDYEQSLLDQENQSLGFNFSYPLTAALSMGIDTSYNRTELMDIDRKDNEYSIGSSLNYRLSRMLISTLDLRYRYKSSTQSAQDFSASSVFVSLVYSPAPR